MAFYTFNTSSAVSSVAGSGVVTQVFVLNIAPTPGDVWGGCLWLLPADSSTGQEFNEGI